VGLRVRRPVAGIGAGPPNLLHGRVGGGAVHASARDTCTFTADGNGNVELASLFPARCDRTDRSRRIASRIA